jgi:hypothetical protein
MSKIEPRPHSVIVFRTAGDRDGRQERGRKNYDSRTPLRPEL